MNQLCCRALCVERDEHANRDGRLCYCCCHGRSCRQQRRHNKARHLPNIVTVEPTPALTRSSPLSSTFAVQT
ncbi:hypothetical protein L484_021722 [Morus notabilis]|uniref:Uncharacterized protein n=1 Tax=Morus notabilis TaxID=981085 RepID=W9S6X6_9ROSA|nr:hypothetical protein L484_021722 [Morus notabilis]